MFQLYRDDIDRYIIYMYVYICNDICMYSNVCNRYVIIYGSVGVCWHLV